MLNMWNYFIVFNLKFCKITYSFEVASFKAISFPYDPILLIINELLFFIATSYKHVFIDFAIFATLIIKGFKVHF